MKLATAGTFESNDCMITVKPHKELKIEIESIVFEQFGEQIEHVVKETLKELHIEHVHVFIHDKGALDYCIKARLITAMKRLGDIHA